MWARSAHASKLNPALHDCCRVISGCLKPANVDSIHLLAGVAPPHIRRTVASRMERSRQTTDTRHQLFNHQPAASRLKSRKSFMHTVRPLDSSPSNTRLHMWNTKLTDAPISTKMGLEAAETLPAGSDQEWLCWRSLNRLRTGVGRAKTTMQEVGLHRRHTVSELWLWWTTDDGPPPLLSTTGRGLRSRGPCHCHRTGKGVRPEVATHCVKDTKEEGPTL